MFLDVHTGSHVFVDGLVGWGALDDVSSGRNGDLVRGEVGGVGRGFQAILMGDVDKDVVFGLGHARSVAAFSNQLDVVGAVADAVSDEPHCV